MNAFRIAVIGAGLAGISAATALSEAGHQVTLFDKSRGSGGRMSSKRTDYGDFDMGAQYFTARDFAFRQALQKWLDQGWVAEWTPKVYLFDENGLSESADDQQRFVGAPRMTALSRQLIGDLELVGQTRISHLQQNEDRSWLLVDDTGAIHGAYDRVIVATPAPQAVELLAPAPLLAQAASQAGMLAGWTLALAFDEPLATDMEACFVRAGPLDWISRNSSKPGRTGVDSWVMQSTPEWAAEHIDADHLDIAQHLQKAFAEVTGLELPAPTFAHVHRWLYARPAEQCNWGALAAPELGIYVCGDWCLGGRLENAWLSGQQTAKTLM